MGRGKVEEALRLVGLAYDTALSGRDWTGLLKALTASVDAQSAMIRMVDYTERKVGFFDQIGYDPAFPQQYREHLIEIEPYQNYLESYPGNKPISADIIYGGAQKRRHSEFYNAYERRMGMEHIAGIALARNGTMTLGMGIHRSKQTGDFDSESLALLEMLTPHISRAVQMQQLLAAAFANQMLAESALDRLSVGVVLADAHLRPVFVNRMAEQLIAASGGALRLTLRSLDTKDPAVTKLLRRLVAEAAATTTGKGLTEGGDIRMACGDGSFLQLCVTPLSRQRLDCEIAIPAACAAIFIARPGSIKLPWRRVALYYGLTPAEAKLATQLVNGGCLEEAAERLGVSFHTARAQLRSIFAKTGVCRQSELVTTLLQGVLGKMAPFP